MDWLYSNAVGGVKVVVREEDYDLAADILDLPAEETPEAAEGTQTGAKITAPYCPSCGLTTITKIPKLRLFAILAALFYGVGVAVHQPDLAAAAIAVVAIALMLTSSHRCSTCGERFNWEGTNVDETPLPRDLQDEHCPRCGSVEIYSVYHRRLKALSMFEMLGLLVLAPWPFLPKRKCDACGLKTY